MVVVSVGLMRDGVYTIGFGIDTLLEFRDLIVTLYAVLPAYHIVARLEEEKVGGKGKEYRRNFIETMPDGEDVYLLLAHGYEEGTHTRVGGGLEIGTTVIEDKDAFLERLQAVECTLRVPDMALYATEDIVALLFEFIERVHVSPRRRMLVPLDDVRCDNECTLPRHGQYALEQRGLTRAVGAENDGHLGGSRVSHGQSVGIWRSSSSS